jgi:hypothetical protein
MSLLWTGGRLQGDCGKDEGVRSVEAKTNGARNFGGE